MISRTNITNPPKFQMWETLDKSHTGDKSILLQSVYWKTVDPNKIILLTPRLLHLISADSDNSIISTKTDNQISKLYLHDNLSVERDIKGKMHAQNKRGKGNYGVHPHNAMCIVYMWPNKQDKRCMHWAGGWWKEGQDETRLHRYMQNKNTEKKTWFQPKLHTCYVDELVAIR